MTSKTLVYWIGIVGVQGKGPNLMIDYNPNQTIGDLIQLLINYRFTENGKRPEILKFKPGDVSKYDVNNPYWAHNVKLSEYVAYYNDPSKDKFFTYCLV
jgi:hypothetical protein